MHSNLIRIVVIIAACYEARSASLPSLTGTWQMTTVSSSATLLLAQNGSNLTGVITAGGQSCSASVTGTVGSTLNPLAVYIFFNSPGDEIVLTASSDGNSMTGTFYGSPIPVCAGLDGNVVGYRSTISLNTNVLNFAFQTSGSFPTGQSLVLSSGTPIPFTVGTSGGSWFAVTPNTSDTAPVALVVTVNPAGLSVGSYYAQIVLTLSSTGGPTGGPIALYADVILTITASVPAVGGVRNAGSGATGPAAPGEIISIYASSNSSPIGPVTGVGLELNQNGSVATVLGGVQVWFLPVGVYAPLTYAGAGQVNAVVPYEVAGMANLQLVVVYQGQRSSSFPLQGATTAPGVFTANGTGSGPGPILNQDGTFNGPSAPEAKGGIVVLFLTGEGQTMPAGTTGKVTKPAAAPPLTPVPSQVPTVLIGGMSAPVLFDGEAPGLVAGVLQINVQIPQNAQSGDLPVLVSIGNGTSQNGVTVSVK
jgi:uncharacterized protein (TIGR03437 family)